MKVLGLDLSLTATGYVVLDRDGALLKSGVAGFSLTRTAPSAKKIERLLAIARAVAQVAKETEVTDVCIENYAFSAKGAQNDLGELHGVIKTQLYLSGLVCEYIASTQARAIVFKTGKRIEKKQVIPMLEGMGHRFEDHNVADAYVIAEAYRQKLIAKEETSR